MTAPTDPPTPEKMPHGIGNAYLFQVFNTISFTIVLGTPMILYFKHLGASATVLGIVAALAPLLNILQIPAAHFVERVGYRTFMLRGWFTRSLFIVAMAAVPWAPDKINVTTRVSLLLFLLFAFNASRGISVCGFLPWITHLIPESLRGRFLSRDQMSSALAGLGTMLLAALFLRGETQPSRFAVMFLASFTAAMVSLLYLRKIPDVPVSPRTKQPNERVPWKEMLLYPPFLKLMAYNFVCHVAFAAGSVFWIPFLRDEFGFTDSNMLNLAAAGSAVVAASLFGFGRVVDRVGSRPLLALAGLCHIVHFAGWSAVGARLLPLNLPTLALQTVTAGVGGALFGLANTRLAMGTVPAMGRSHFFALFSVITSLTLGVLPVFWGMFLDGLTGWTAQWPHWQWNPYSVLYCVLALIMVVAQYFRIRLAEPSAMSTEAFFHDLFVEPPSRVVAWLLSRRLWPWS